MASAEEYAGWIVKNADKKGTPEFETVANAYAAARAEQPEKAASTPTAAPGPSVGDRMLDIGKAGLRALPGGMLASQPFDTQRDYAAGAVRGAGSIGATLMQPIDWAARKMGVGESIGLGRKDRREAMTGALGEMGADTDSAAFQAGKIGAEIAGTAGVGGTLAKGAMAVPAVAKYAPGVATALRTSGIGQQAGNVLTRMGAGAVTGGVSAGLVNPEDAGLGAAIGAAIPGVGGALGKLAGVARGPEQAPELAKAVSKARASGYVIPPTQANASIGNRLLEGLSGKISTAQNASAANQEVTNRLARSAIGVTDDVPLSAEVLDGVRKEAGQAYGAIAKIGKLEAAGSDLPASVGVRKFTDPLTLAKRNEVDSAEVIRAWKQANHDATAYYRAYARDANPETLTKAKNAAAEAGKIDNFLEGSLSKMGMDDMVTALKDARVRIAKTYSVEKAMDAATGTVDARKLASEFQKGKPLSGELKDVAEFAGRFPKAAQRPEAMGSLPGLSPLDWAAGGAMSTATANPLFMLATGARPIARYTALSPLVQNRLVQDAPNPLLRAAAAGVGRAAPVTGAELRRKLEDDR